MLIAQIEKAARDEQEHLKAQLEERINYYSVVFGPFFKEKMHGLSLDDHYAVTRIY